MIKKTFLKPFDIPVIALALALTIATGAAVYSGGTASSRVVIRGQDKTWIFPLNAETTVSVPGPIGETKVEIHGGHAEIVSSPCEGQTCVAAGAVSKNGQWVACLPNKVFLLIEAAGNGDAGGDTIDASCW